MNSSQIKKLWKILYLPTVFIIWSDLLIIYFFLSVNQSSRSLVNAYGLKNTWNIVSITLQPVGSTHGYTSINFDFVWVLLILVFKDGYFFLKYYGKDTKQTPS
jgi:hypothetical protein